MCEGGGMRLWHTWIVCALDFYGTVFLRWLLLWREGGGG